MSTPPKRNPINTPAGFNPPAEAPREVGPLQRVRTFWKKNRGLAGNPNFRKIARRMLALRARTTFRQSKILSGPDLIFVATHHKAMTTYFHAVQKSLAFALNIPFERLQGGYPPSARTRMFLSMQGKQDLTKLPRYRGVHVMRDPRDMMVSGYHYHKWTHEEWVHRLDDNGESYQDKLNRLNKTEGLFLEIDHFIFYYRETLENWNMEDPDMLEVSYESLMQPGKDRIYGDIFRHLGFVDEELELAQDLMRLFEAQSRSGKSGDAISQKSHVRSGKSGQWEAELEPKHLAYIEQELGPVLRKFGYT